MGTILPKISEISFHDGVRNLSPISLDPEVLHALFLHYEALRQWNPRLSLIGPGTAGEISGFPKSRGHYQPSDQFLTGAAV